MPQMLNADTNSIIVDTDIHGTVPASDDTTRLGDMSVDDLAEHRCMEHRQC